MIITVTRALAIALLTTSISAFAASEKARGDKNTDCKNTESEDIVLISFADQPSAGQDESPSEERVQKSEEQQKIQKQDAEWLHDLQGIYGG